MLVVRHAVVGPFAENTWLVADTATRDAILVDPGGELDRVLALCRPEGFRVTRIVLTHGHVDHVAGVAAAQERLGVPCQLHALDAEWAALAPRQAEMFGFDETFAAPRIDHHHEHGETFQVGGEEARIIHTPGHSRGSCCIAFPAARVVVTGDTLFAGSVGRTDLPGGDFEALERSIQDRLFPLGDDVRFFPGHGPAGVLGDERRTNPFVGEASRRGRFL
jgi:glyoxylase-like metal-dependent hydrolase (beta-lactamase superfamily II)